MSHVLNYSLKEFAFFLIALFYLSNDCLSQGKQPNVILILTDDQGIGDLGCHGNPWLKTPNLDKFYDQSVRLTDFHVSPLCTPTRSAIITGQYPINNGAWATYKGRDLLSGPTHSTIANLFKENGYKTAMFGKWHLGDNYPVRPSDCGFDLAVQHHAGGVGELSDYWGNSYFDDVYFVNNKPTSFEGYCTDVWFNETIKFIDKSKHQPFFIYLSTNAPHDPLIVDEKYSRPYKHLEGDKILSANLYGMIANIDENFGRLRKYLKKNKLEENTILIFMTDNGTRFGYSVDGKFGYNKGYRGIKGSKHEGGHRATFFIRWPNADIEGGKDIESLTAHVDIMPTLASLCKLSATEINWDGIDLSGLIKGGDFAEDRAVYIHHRQDWRPPKDIEQTCLMKGDWRLVSGTDLYNVSDDPQQKNDISSENQDIVDSLLRINREFLSSTKRRKEYREMPVNLVGNPAQHEVKLTIQHAIGEDSGFWKC